MLVAKQRGILEVNARVAVEVARKNRCSTKHTCKALYHQL